MSFLSYFRAAAIASALAVFTIPAMAQSLTTAYDSGASRAGITFDLTATQDITINSFDINVGGVGDTGTGAGQSATVAIYWRAGTATGFDDSSAGWTLLGTTQVISEGNNNPTPVPLGGLGLAAGQTYGLYVDLVNFIPTTHAIRYTTIVAPATASDGTLTLASGSGKDSPVFSETTFTPRMFNGTVYYTLGIAPTTTCASEGYTGTKLTWCKNICEKGYTGATLDIWIHRWINRYRDLPYCAQEGGGEEPPPQET
jgi:hypothetical protein